MQIDYPTFGHGTRPPSSRPTPHRSWLRIGLLFCASLLALGAHANQPEEEEEGGDLSDESGVIIQSPSQDVIEEYRINGKLYMIRVTPQKGAPYYLVDADGDGELETRTNELAPDYLIPSWVIFSW